MKTDRDKGQITLDSGRKLHCFGGAIGLTPDGWIVGGWDDSIYLQVSDEPFTPEERKEIAEEMIERWRKWAEKPGEPAIL